MKDENDTQESFPRLRRIREAIDRVVGHGDHKVLLGLAGSDNFGQTNVWLKVSYDGGFYELYFSRESKARDVDGVAISEFTRTVEYPRTPEGFEKLISTINTADIEKTFAAAREPDDDEDIAF